MRARTGRRRRITFSGKLSNSRSRLLQTTTCPLTSTMQRPCGMLLRAVSKRPTSRLTSRPAIMASSSTQRSRLEMNFREAKKEMRTKAKMV
jgi:hypothetical protein